MEAYKETIAQSGTRETGKGSNTGTGERLETGRDSVTRRMNGNRTKAAFEALDAALHAAASVYANVHRGSGHFSRVSTSLYEQARSVVLDYLKLNPRNYTVAFGSARRTALIAGQLPPASYVQLSSADIGLNIGVSALAVQKRVLRQQAKPSDVGGGNAKLVARDWVIWANGAELFEAGTPAVINVITFAKALQLTATLGAGCFMDHADVHADVNDILYRDNLGPRIGKALQDALVDTLVGKNASVPTGEGMRRFVNLDSAASTPTFASVLGVFQRMLRECPETQREVVSTVRSICAQVLGAPESEYDIIFTANTTESINCVAKQLGIARNAAVEPVILTTMLEHSSNDLPWRQVPGHRVRHLEVGDDGLFDLDALESLLYAYNVEEKYGNQRIRLVALTGASNVLGTCNDLEAISDIVHRHQARLLVDGAQLVPHRAVDIAAANIDYFAFSGHKIYAPFGAGVLVVKKDSTAFDSAAVEAVGASGEENAAGIAALGKALLLLHRIGMDRIARHEQMLARRAFKGLQCIDGLELYGMSVSDDAAFAHKTGVIIFALKGVMPNKIGEALAWQRGIGLRHGCHCAHMIIKQQFHMGRGMQQFQKYMQLVFPQIKFPGLVRVSFGIHNSKEDVDAFIGAMEELAANRSLMKVKAVLPRIDAYVAEHRRRVYGD